MNELPTFSYDIFDDNIDIKRIIIGFIVSGCVLISIILFSIFISKYIFLALYPIVIISAGMFIATSMSLIYRFFIYIKKQIK